MSDGLVAQAAVDAAKSQHTRLLRVFYLSGLPALKSCAASRTYYDRKRAEGKHISKGHVVPGPPPNVLWAMLRDGTTYTPVSVTAPCPAA